MPLSMFHPVIEAWFSERFGCPTSAQALGWPRIAGGEHVLLTAPTGSGKTLTAFLWAIDSLVQGRWRPGGVRVLYVSPLRALNNDIRRNLKQPLEEIEAAFGAEGKAVPQIRVATRSGDTKEGERRAMLRSPPEILITTPESLNILLTTQRAEGLFSGVRTVILDEVHAVASSKRGTHLITAVERLTRMAGEFQRIALSATVRPLDRIARWVGGFQRDDSGELAPRSVTVLEATQEKSYSLRVRFVTPSLSFETSGNLAGEHPMWIAAAKAVAERVDANHSTLVFANSRRGVERLARLVNAGREDRRVYSHHGSLSREIREVVEERLKKGELKGIVATNSLELGIDVGAVNEVVLFETPPTVSSLVQRVGRAGHGVGQTSRGLIIAIYPDDLIKAAVMTGALEESAVEPLSPPEAPLDVLAQLILSMTAFEVWKLDALFDSIRASAPYSTLSRRRFDLVVEMLTGRYQGARVPALKPRLSVDRTDDTARAMPGTARVLYASGGTIPDRGYFAVRLRDTRAAVGELDEEFVWERKIGDIITLGVQAWRVEQIGVNDVTVSPCGALSATPPFWTCEERFYGADFALLRGSFLERAEDRLDDGRLAEDLKEEYHFDEMAADALVRFLRSQRAHLGTPLPHRHHVVLEYLKAPSQAGMTVTVVHNEWGGRVNRPLALALSSALTPRGSSSFRVAHDDRSVAVMQEEPLEAEALFELVTPANLEALVLDRLGSTGLFGACFRENAARALLLLRRGFGRRTPLWLTRERSKALKAEVAALEDFPVSLETYRTCLWDDMEMDALKERLCEVADGAITLTEVVSASPSPFASAVLWKLTGDLMYEDDTPVKGASQPTRSLLDEVALSSELRPGLSREVVRELEAKLQRTHPGYAPRDAVELVEWVKERLVLTSGEWEELVRATARDHGVAPETMKESLELRIVSSNGLVLALESWPRIAAVLGMDPKARLASVFDGGRLLETERLAPLLEKLFGYESHEERDLRSFLEEWLRFYGPVSISDIVSVLGVARAKVEDDLVGLAGDRAVVVDRITEGALENEVCDLANLRRLLAASQKARRPALEPLPIEKLPVLLAGEQRVGAPDPERSLEEVLDALFGYAASPWFFEQEIFPARLLAYRKERLDSLLMTSNLEWLGVSEKKVVFSLSEDRDLFAAKRELGDGGEKRAGALLPSDQGRFSLAEVERHRGELDSRSVKAELVEAAWSGLVSCNTFAPLREVGDDVRASGRPGGRARFGRQRLSSWKSTTDDASLWFALPSTEDERDALEEEELNRDRARMLLDRYGVLFRELLNREIPALRWSALFRTLRLMELSGEVAGGCFFKGVPGIQFASESALKKIAEGLDHDRVFWLNAADPASAAGLGVPGLDLPPRKSTTHLVYRGDRLVLVSKRTGKILDFRVEPDDPRIRKYLRFLEVLLTRDVKPLTAITVEEINGKPAAQSPFRPHLEALFDTAADHRTLRLSRRY